MKFSADSLGSGAVLTTQIKPKSVRTLESDASPSDVAHHHSFLEPSATDTLQREWEDQRQVERRIGRSMDPFEWKAVTGGA